MVPSVWIFTSVYVCAILVVDEFVGVRCVPALDLDVFVGVRCVPALDPRLRVAYGLLETLDDILTVFPHYNLQNTKNSLISSNLHCNIQYVSCMCLILPPKFSGLC